MIPSVPLLALNALADSLAALDGFNAPHPEGWAGSRRNGRGPKRRPPGPKRDEVRIAARVYAANRARAITKRMS